MTQRKLTIGTLTCDDYDGVYFTLQSIRMYHPEVLNDIEFVVLDNRPESAHGQAVKQFVEGWVKEPARYIPVTDVQGTAPMKDRVMNESRTPYVLCMDCHVLLVPGALRKLIDFFDTGADEGNLLQGPLLYDDQQSISTHFDPVWRGHMWGIWATDERGKGSEPFEIPAQGMGAFACRRNSWVGFNPHFRGFGAEECYIHEKFRQAGKKTLCLPFLKWVHRFGRPNGVPYRLTLEDRIWNYIVGHIELGLDVAAVMDHFSPTVGREKMNRILGEVECLLLEPAA